MQVGNRTSWLDYVFPRFCFGCQREGELWCRACQQQHVLQPGESECPFCRTHGSLRTCAPCSEQTYLDGLFALSFYADPVMRRAIRLWKYAGDRTVEPVIKRFVRSYVIQRHLSFLPDVIAYVPLHVRKKRLRGFDQANCFAEIVSETCGIRCQPLLMRSKMTASQAAVTQSQRYVGDMDGVFRVCADLPKKILICDDVFTSGATMDAAAKSLKAAGAKEVWGLVLAKGSTGV